MKHKKQGIILLLIFLLALLFSGSVSAADTNKNVTSKAGSISENAKIINTVVNNTKKVQNIDPVISGKITESPSNLGLNGVLVTIRDTGGTILAWTLTGSDGTYSTNFNNPATVYRVTASKVGYNSYTKQITVSHNPANPSDPNLYGTANIRLHKIPAYSGNASGYLLNLGALPQILLDLYACKSNASVTSTTSPYATGGGTPLEVKLLNGSLLSGLLDVYSSGDDGPKTGGINPENLPDLLQDLGLEVGAINAHSNSGTNPPQSSGESEVASVKLSLLLQLIEVINLNLISSNSSVTPNFNTGALVSSSGNGLTSISLLGGTLVIDALQASATASANGHPGGANANFHWSVADIKLLGISILSGLTATGSVNLPGILTISLGAEDEYTSPDGTYARASGNALNIELLGALFGGVKLTLGHAEAAAQVPIGGLAVTTADIGITKTVDKTIANPGDVLHYTVTVTNNGPDSISGLTATDVLPAGLHIESSNGDGTYVNGLWTINRVLTSGSTATLNIFAKVIESNISITNVASVNIPSDVYDPNPDNDQDEVTTVIGSVSDLSIVKTVDKTIANLGDVLLYTLTVTNKGPNSVSNVTVNDLLSDKLQWISDDGNGAYNHTTGIWTISKTLTSGSSAILTITAKVIVSNTTISNTAIVNVPPGRQDPNTDDNKDTVIVTVNAASDLGVTKKVDNSNPEYQQNITFTLTAHNYGPDIAKKVIVTDKLPTGLEFVSTNGNYNSDIGIWTIGDLETGKTVTLNIVAKMMVLNTPLTNIAVISGANYDPNSANNRASVTITTGSAADLGITKTVNNSRPRYLQNVTFTLTARNYGPNTATGVVVEDSLPKGLKFVSVDGQYNPTTGTWTIGTLAKNKTAIIHITAKAITPSTKLTNIAVISGAIYDPNSANNRASATVNVKPAADLALTITVNKARPKYLEKVIYTITAYNYGPMDAKNVSVTIKMPSGLKYTSNDSRGKYNPKTGVLTIGNLKNGAKVELHIIEQATVSNVRLTTIAKIKGTAIMK